MNAIINSISSLVGDARLASALVSMIPLLELKSGILFAREAGLDFFWGFFYPYIGSTLVFLPIFFLLKPVLGLLEKIKWFKSFSLKVQGYFKKKAQDVRNKNRGNLTDTAIKMLGVFIFVAVPLPMTGVWTGTAVAVFLELKFKEAVLPIVAGNIVAGLVISLLAQLFRPYLDIILYGLLALALVLLVIVIIKIALVKPEDEKK